MNLVHAGFLAAAAAAAVPVLVHLLFRRRAQLVAIGTLRFLKIAVVEDAHRRRLRRWLLLAMRVAGVLLLALLFARPYISSESSLGRDQEVVLLVDQSASMDARRDGPSSFARAQEAAAEMLRQLPANTVTHLGWFDARGVERAEEPRIDHRRRPSFAGSDYGQALTWARDVLARSRRRDRRVVLFTDLQRNGLPSARLRKFPANVPVLLVDAGRAVTHNLAVEDVRAAVSEIRKGEPLVVAARLWNAGVFPANDVQVRLALQGPSGAIERSMTRSLAAGAREVVRFELSVDQPGLYQGYAEVESDDGLTFDNRRWLAFQARPTERILLLDGHPGNGRYAQETYYLEAALRPHRGEGPSRTATPFEPVRHPWQRGRELPPLSGFRAVMACNVEGWSDGQADSLARYVEFGGRLVVFAGDQVRNQGYAALFEKGLLPAAFESAVSPGRSRFHRWSARHPLLRPLSDPQHGDLRTLTFDRTLPLRVRQGAKVLVRDQAGHPLLVEGRFGRGRVLIFAVAADRDWGDWTANRLYLPLVHQVAGYASGRLAEQAVVRDRAAGSAREHPPGISHAAQRVWVSNCDSRESEVARISADELRRACGLSTRTRLEAPKGVAAGILPPRGAERPDEWWRNVAWVLLAVLMAESFLANRTPA